LIAGVNVSGETLVFAGVAGVDAVCAVATLANVAIHAYSAQRRRFDEGVIGVILVFMWCVQSVCRSLGDINLIILGLLVKIVDVDFIVAHSWHAFSLQLIAREPVLPQSEPQSLQRTQDLNMRIS